jgi:hypothetical protein
MGIYANKAEIARFFGITSPTVSKRVKGIEEEIKAGTYWKRLQDRNLRKTVPPFDVEESYKYCLEGERKRPIGVVMGGPVEKKKMWNIKITENEMLSLYGTKKEAYLRAEELSGEVIS